MLVYTQGRDGLLEDKVWIKIRVMLVVAIAGPPAGIDRKLRQVSEPMSDQVWIHSGRGAAHQTCETHRDLPAPLPWRPGTRSETGDE